MAFTQIERKLWEGFCDVVGKYALGNHIEIEIASLDIGDQIEESWIEFVGLSYDRAKDIMYVHTPAETHPILNPTSVIIDEMGIDIKSVTVKDADDELYIILFRKPLQLPDPSQRPHGWSQAQFRD